MLGTATVVTTELGLVIETELVVGDQEEVELDTAILGQLGDQQALMLEQLQTFGRKLVGVADPDVEIGAAALADGGGTAIE